MTLTPTLSYRIAPGGHLTGTVRVPGDKSISHRAIMLGALAEGITTISGFLEGADSLATLRAFRQLGVTISEPVAGAVQIRGVGLHGLQASAMPLDLGNSGTSMRLLAGLLAGQRFATTLIGDASLSRRPMQRVIAPLMRMGARIHANAHSAAPLYIEPVAALNAIDYVLPIASAQVKSCLLLAGLYATGTTCITEAALTRDHTERMLLGLGYPLQRDGMQICVRGGGHLRGGNIDVPADISSAAFFCVGASISPGADLTLTHVGINPTRLGVIHILQAMGADIVLMNCREVSGEPVADLRVRAAPLRGITIPAEQVPLAIDEFPALFIAAACASGETRLHDAAELRVKESDRIQAMADGLQLLGIDAQPLPDGIIIQGGSLGGGRINSHGDHRVAMAFALAGLRASDDIIIDDCANVNTSFPGFVDLAARLGLRIMELNKVIS